MIKNCPALFAASLLLATASAAQAEPAAPKGPTPSQKANYSLPMLMRPAAAPTLVRLDSAIALQDKATTLVPVLTGAYALQPNLSVFGRAGMVQQSPETGPSPTALSNPFVFAQYILSPAPSIKLALMGGSSIPVGAGGGNDPNKTNRHRRRNLRPGGDGQRDVRGQLPDPPPRASASLT